MAVKRVRGSVWENTAKKEGFTTSVGSYEYRSAGDRHFVLTSVSTGKTRVYESPQAAKDAGWVIVEHGK